MAVYDTLVAKLQQGALLLTANKRLYRYLREFYAESMLATGKQAWQTPQLYSYEGWLQHCLAGSGDGWRLLSTLQLQFIWEDLVEQSARQAGLDLLQIGKTAAKAVQAYQLLNEYGLSLAGQPLTLDQQVFWGWCEEFQLLKEERQWLDKSDLARHVAAAVSRGDLVLPREIMLIGFDQLPPGLTLLQQRLQTDGYRCEEYPFQHEPAEQMSCCAASDRREEVETAARWARQLLEEGATSIGIVVPDLKRRRSAIERAFRNQIDPAAILSLSDEESLFTLSLGAPLAEQGVIHSALELLGVGRTLSMEQVSFLLRTPYLGRSLAEQESRALFDAQLRAFRQQSFTLGELINLLARREDLAAFAGLVEQLQVFLADNAQRLPGEWVQLISGHLHSLGWPGERVLASSEYQALKSWQEHVLAALPLLDSLHQPISRAKFLQLLRRLSRETEFQQESATGPLQVVGLLESTGLHFEHLWVMGMEERLLPAPAQPNPFIPSAMQVAWQMPHASAERELVYAEQVMARLQRAARKIVFSYPRYEGDSPVQATPLLPEGMSDQSLRLAPAQDMLMRISSQAVRCEELVDDCGPRLEQTLVEGGTGLLKDQAHCPFRAFVHHRLLGRKFEAATSGLSAMIRGDLVHIALEKIWQQLETRAALQGLSAGKRQTLIAEQAAVAVTDYFSRRPQPPEPLIRLEQERIAALLEEWLTEIELQRDDFRVVELEKEHKEELGPLQIRLKVDRIDELACGQRIVIDYKTGSQLRRDDLVSVPLLEPQLPIYAVAGQGEAAAGVVFAQVRKNSCKLQGVVSDAGLLDRVEAVADWKKCQQLDINDWDELLAFWQGQIQQLATDFVAGKAAVIPFDPTISCQYCDLQGVCRIQEYRTINAGGDDDDC